MLDRFFNQQDVVRLIENAQLDGVSLSNYYTRQQIDALLAVLGSNHSHDVLYYLKDEIDTLLASKANASDVYTIAEINNIINAFVTEDDLTNALSAKANSSDVYTKSQIDTLLSAIYTKSQIDTLLTSKSDTSHTHTPSYTQPPITSNLYTHLDALDSSFSNSQWDDISGNGRHATNISGSNLPSKNSNYIDFTNAYLAFSFTLAQPFTIYICTDLPTSNSILFGASGAYIAYRQSSTLTFNCGNEVNHANMANSTTKSVLFAAVNGGSSISWWSSVANSGNYGSNGLTNPRVNYIAGTGYGAYKVHALLIYSTAHNTTQRDEVIAYLNARFV